MSALPTDAHDEGPSVDWSGEDEDFWSRCSLTTILSDPPLHELKLPGGQVIRLRTQHFLDVRRFTVAFIDATGSFPPLPKKKSAKFLEDQFRTWLVDRNTTYVDVEASDRGTLLGDIKLALLACPETDDPRDLDRGSLFTNEAGDTWVNARMLLERVRRTCPIKLSPGDFYVALGSLGATALGVKRLPTWRGRVWLIPATLRPEAPELPPAPAAVNGAHKPSESASTAHAEESPEREPGMFDDLLDPP